MFESLYTAEQSHAIDQHVIQSGTAGIVLMKRAARAAFSALRTKWPAARRITVCCGGGNNGGDGYLLAALAAEQQCDVTVVALVPHDKLTGDASLAASYAQGSGVGIQLWSEDTGPLLSGADVIVDGLLGTGFTGDLRPAFTEAIQAINASGRPVLALDLPSGLSADTGWVASVAVKSDITVTFIVPKRGLYTAMSADVCGEILLADLCIDQPALNDNVPDVGLLDLDDMQQAFLPRRSRTAHKGHFGHVMVIGGDKGMGGAVLLAAEMAARSGAGLTSVATQPEHVAAVIARRPEIMTNGVVSGQALEPLLSGGPTVLVVGPGLGRTPWSEQMLQQATLTALPLVLDADALNILAEGRVVRQPRRDNWVLTPHPAEAARLLGIDTASVQRDRFAAVRALQVRYGGVIVLKGSGTLVCGPDGKIGVCTAGNPGMASGGMGDLLAGLVGGLLAQGIEAAWAARLAVCLHAAAADIAAEIHGERGLLAGDLFDYLAPLLNQA